MNQIGFNASVYEIKQRQACLERIHLFAGQTLYLEVGGYLIEDDHAARVLPGFDPFAKVRILRPLLSSTVILFCVNMLDLVQARVLNAGANDYESTCLELLKEVETAFGLKPTVILNFFPEEPDPIVQTFCKRLERLQYVYKKRYFIQSYPENSDLILGPQGFMRDEYIEHSEKLILVTGVSSNSGKFSTCLGQIWQDHNRGVRSAYAKYELFPIYNLPLEHPVNLAYEAATIDIGDQNCLDHYHESAYHQKAVNYNRDIEAFELLLAITQSLVTPEQPPLPYQSPTDMGINEAGFAIENDYVIAQAGLEEIKRRHEFYQDLLDKGEGREEWVKKAEELEELANSFFDC